MRHLLPLLVLLAGFSSYGEELKMADGEIFTFESIKKTEPDGLVVLTDSGVSKIRFSKMSEEDKMRYGYDPAKDKGFQEAKQQAAITSYQQSIGQPSEKNIIQPDTPDTEKDDGNAAPPLSGTPNSLPEKTIEEFNMALMAEEPISEKIGIVGNKKLVKPPPVKGKSIYMEIPYWPTEEGIWDEIRLARGEREELRNWQDQPNNWEAGAICTCASMVLEFYGTKASPREIFQNASGLNYDPSRRFREVWADRWYDGVITGLNNKGYVWEFKDLRKDHTQFQRDLEILKDSLDKGTPAIVSVSIPPKVNQYAKWHGVVVQGYDETKQAIYITDPTISRPGQRVISYKNFEKIWHTLDGANMRYIMFTSLKQ
jgi:hypothetical protein